jgi:hypothetical protein
VSGTAGAKASSRFPVQSLQAAALKPRINSGGDLNPQTHLCGEQRVDFDTAQLPSLFMQLRERSLRRPNELVSQFLIRQEPADGSFNRSL